MPIMWAMTTLRTCGHADVWRTRSVCGIKKKTKIKIDFIELFQFLCVGRRDAEKKATRWCWPDDTRTTHTHMCQQREREKESGFRLAKCVCMCVPPPSSLLCLQIIQWPFYSWQSIQKPNGNLFGLFSSWFSPPLSSAFRSAPNFRCVCVCLHVIRFDGTQNKLLKFFFSVSLIPVWLCGKLYASSQQKLQ